MIERAKTTHRRCPRVRILSFIVFSVIVLLLIIESGKTHYASAKIQLSAPSGVHNSGLVEPAELTGAAAINYLKQRGTYGSLLEATNNKIPDAQLVTKHSTRAKEQVAAAPSTGTTPWDFEERLLPSDGSSLDNFGVSVAISGDTAIVGSRKYRNGPGEGEVYIFVNDGVFWSQQAILRPPSSASQINLFGLNVAISGNSAIVGALDLGLNGTTDKTVAYVYSRKKDVWGDPQVLSPGNAGKFLSGNTPVAISGNVAVIGMDNATNFGIAAC